MTEDAINVAKTQVCRILFVDGSSTFLWHMQFTLRGKMASRILHLAVTNCILKAYNCKDRNRLEIGSILPDAAISGNSHLKVNILDGAKKTYDLPDFRSTFASHILEDDLYLGYYLHLIQDLLFRDLVYHRYHWNPLPPGNVERLHNDYALINQYVIQKYALSDNVAAPASFDAEPLNKLGCFAINQFLDEIKNDFKSSPTGEIFFFTKEMADEFIVFASEKCRQEIDSLHNGVSCVDATALAWQRKTLQQEVSADGEIL